MACDIDVLVIGAGMSGMALAIELKQNFPGATYQVVEKSDDLAGTWTANTYPGCGCDVASHFYSYSFALNPNWTSKYSLGQEISAYFRTVATRYGVLSHILYSLSVQKAIYDETTAIWEVSLTNVKTNETVKKRCRFLVSAVGGLSTPQKCKIPGAEDFKGKLFHSAAWDHSFDWAGKDVVVVGNGCSATQFVPILTNPGPSSVNHLTQFSRQAHWIAERPNPTYSPLFKFVMRHVPFSMRLYRWYLYYQWEKDWPAFRNTASGLKLRSQQSKTQIEYIKRTAPEKYYDALIPKTEIGCKRKVQDTDYLSSLHRSNITLIPSTTDTISRITPTGVLTTSGSHYPASAIILATGFQTQQPLSGIEVRGLENKTLQDHWNEVSEGTPSAYFGTMVAGFPNFFWLMGPNVSTGHLSVIFHSECQANFIMRVLKPILGPEQPWFAGLRAKIHSTAQSLAFKLGIAPTTTSSSETKPLLQPSTTPPPKSVHVLPAAERADNEWIQTQMKNLVWSSGCSSWYTDEKSGRNTMLYPDWMWKFWLRSLWVKRGDVEYEGI